VQANDTLHLPGPLVRHCVARNRKAAPVTCKGWFAVTPYPGVKTGLQFQDPVEHPHAEREAYVDLTLRV